MQFPYRIGAEPAIPHLFPIIGFNVLSGILHPVLPATGDISNVCYLFCRPQLPEVTYSFIPLTSIVPIVLLIVTVNLQPSISNVDTFRLIFYGSGNERTREHPYNRFF